MPRSAKERAGEGLYHKVGRDIMELFVELAQAVGIPKSLAEIYGILYASPRPLSFREVCEGTGLSKGSVSQGLRFLKSVGAVKSAEVPERCEYYEPVVELKRLVGGFLRKRVRPQLDHWAARLDRLEADYSAEEVPDETGKLLESRIRKLRRWRAQASLILPTLERLLGS